MSTTPTSTTPLNSTPLNSAPQTPATSHRPVRVGTIVWGALLIAAAIFATLVLLTGPLGAAGVLWTIVGFGTILVLGAIAGGITRSIRRRRAVAASTDRLMPDSSDTPLADD